MQERRSGYTIVLFVLTVVLVVSAICAWAYVTGRRRGELLRVQSGWVVTMDEEMEFPTLMFRSGFSETSVLLGREEIYASEAGREAHGRLTGTRVFFLPIPKEAEGRVMIINSAPGYDAPMFGSYEKLFSLYIVEALPALATGSFLLLFGLVFLILTSLFSITGSESAEHVFGALVSMDLGVWLLCSYGLGSFFLRDPYSAAVERVALIMLFPLVLFLLYFMKDDHVLKNGIIMFTACSVIYVFILLAGVTLPFEIDRLATILQSLGCLAFVLTLILNYYLNISASYLRQREYESLSEKAYVDALTGLPNRKRAQDVFRGLNTAAGNYCIVSLDLDNLKMINDRFGHHEGDEMLISTANILNMCFGEKGFRARMGGDEFAVVLKRVNRDDLEDMLADTNYHLREAGQLEHGVDYSISYGYAFKDECPSGNPEDVFKLADERMYLQKSRKKRGV